MSYRVGGIWWKDAASLKKPFKRGVKGINTSPHSLPILSRWCRLLDTPPRRVRQGAHDIIRMGEPRVQRRVERCEVEQEGYSVMFIYESLLQFWVSWIFWNTNYLEPFETFYISPNLKYKHLHLGTKHSRIITQS